MRRVLIGARPRRGRSRGGARRGPLGGAAVRERRGRPGTRRRSTRSSTSTPSATARAATTSSRRSWPPSSTPRAASTSTRARRRGPSASCRSCRRRPSRSPTSPEASTFTAADLEDPRVNVRYGCYYLRQALDAYDGDVRAAVASYNAGMGAVSRVARRRGRRRARAAPPRHPVPGDAGLREEGPRGAPGIPGDVRRPPAALGADAVRPRARPLRTRVRIGSIEDA